MNGRTDCTTKVLLALLATGVWALLLGPLLRADSVQAQHAEYPAQGAVTPVLVAGETLYVVFNNGGKYSVKAFRAVPSKKGLALLESTPRDVLR